MVVRLAMSGTSSAATAAARVMGATRRGAAALTGDATRGLRPWTLQPNLTVCMVSCMVADVVVHTKCGSKRGNGELKKRFDLLLAAARDGVGMHIHMCVTL